jgi:NAD-dependent DNA ligase
MESKKIGKTNSKNLTRKRMLSFEKLSRDPIPYLESHSLDKAVKLLKEASFQYYKGTPVISDDIFDIVKTYIENKDPKNPVLDEIGAETFGEKVKLPFWMGSLDKIREERGEKAGFDRAIESWKSKHSGNVVVSDKLDGNSALVVYSPKAIKMYSRGDGHQGQDISHLVPLIKGLPKKLPFPNYAVRGELIISKDNWKKGGKGANARNAVAGVMHSKHPDKELASIVEFVAYEQLQPRASASDGTEVMGEFGFKVVYNTSVKTESLTVESLSKILIDRRAKSPYEVDGIVIFHDDEHNQVVGKNPSYAFAFKSILTHEEAEVVVKEVTWAASKDGYLKPLIHFEPVVLAGASIQKATGFNAQYIETNTIGPGSRIVIIRSGDVIPHVVRILTESATGKPSFPENCKYKWNDTHIDIVLEDKSSAEDVIVKRMTYFAKTLDMKGVGEGIIQRLYTNGTDSIKKMLNVKVDELIKIEGFQKKSAEKIVNEIREAVSRADCLTFMDASNLFGRAIGEKKLKLIVSNFPKILEGNVPKEKELSNIDGIGPLTAKQFLDGLPEFFEFMKDIGIPCNKVVAVNTVVSTKPSLSSLTVVFTGMRDKELESEIEARGGKIGSAVSKKTTVVVAKDPTDETGKVKTAKELGVRVVNFETFKKEYI